MDKNERIYNDTFLIHTLLYEVSCYFGAQSDFSKKFNHIKAGLLEPFLSLKYAF